MKRKLLKLLVLTIIVSICVFIIYGVTKKDKINLVVLGDNSNYFPYLKDYLSKKLGTYNIYASKEETINSLNTKINTTSSIKKDLRESKLVTLSIGLNDFYNHVRPNINTKNILDLKDEISLLLPKLDKLLNDIRKYAKYEVILIGYYNPVPFLFNTNLNELDVLFMYIDSMVKDITKKYDIIYLPIYDVFKYNNYITDDIYPNNNGNKSISKQIVTLLSK